MKEKLAFLTPVLPYPPMSGGEHYPYHLARELSREFEVHFICFEKQSQPYSKEQIEHMQEFVILHRVDLGKVSFSTRVLDLVQPHYFKGLQREMLAEIERLIDGAKVVHFDFLRMANLALELNFKEPRPFLSYFTHNFELEIFHQLLVETSEGIKKMQGLIQHRNLLAREKQVIKEVDALVCISERDAKLYEREYRVKAHFANNAVDTRSIEYCPQFEGTPIFIGSLTWGPNSIGLKWFLETVYPHLGEYKFKVIGRTQPGLNLDYINRHSDIELVESPPSVLPYLYESSYSLVPLLDGSGTRGKILESMAAGKPVISTTKGAEGLDVIPEKHLLIADTVEDFQRQIQRIESDQELYENLAHEGREFVVQNHDWAAIGKIFIDLYNAHLK